MDIVFPLTISPDSIGLKKRVAGILALVDNLPSQLRGQPRQQHLDGYVARVPY